MELLSFDVPITKKRFCVYVFLAVLWCVFLIVNVSDLPGILGFTKKAFEAFISGLRIRGAIQLIVMSSMFFFILTVAIYYAFRGLVWFILSPGFCVFYLVKFPVEAVFLFSYLLCLAIYSRKHYIDQKLWLVLSLIPYALGLIFTGNSFFKILVLPLFHLISKRPEVVLGSRFVPGDMLVTPLNSSFEKASMAKFKLSDWWQHIEPYIKHLPSVIFYKGEVLNEEKTIKDSLLTSDIKGIKINHKLIESKLMVLLGRDKEFNATEFLQKAKKIFYLLQSSVSSQSLRGIEHLVSDALYEQLSVKVAEQKSKGIYYRNQELSVKKIEISNVNFDQNYDEITVLVAYQTQDAVYDIKTKALLDKAPEPRTVLEYLVFIRKPSAVSAKGGSLSDSVCPNCGAEVKIGQATVCGTCRSYLRNGAFDWVLTRIAQSYEWVHTNPDLVEGWNEVKKLDPNFNIYNIEDICGVLFWQLRLAEKHNNSEYISRFAFADGVFSPEEEAVLQDMAEKLNYDKYTFNMIVKKAETKTIRARRRGR